MSAAAPLVRIARLSFTTTDLARTQAFYSALGFAAGSVAPVEPQDLAVLNLAGVRARRLPMRLGAQGIEFLCFDPPGRPVPAGSGSTDLWFQHIAIAVSDLAAAQARAEAAGAVPITLGGPQVLPPNTGRVGAWKFRDPDGHPLELLHFPPGQGDRAWQQAGAGPCLGIDHTAIAVSDPARSRRFYEDLGFSARDGSLNAGPEQERLDDVADDRVRVVPLNPPEAPPHLELLGYAVGSRRPMPPDTRATDVWATRTILEGVGGTDADRLIHDPDGHALILTRAG